MCKVSGREGRRRHRGGEEKEGGGLSESTGESVNVQV